MMNVLVWKSYGDIKVYEASSADQIEGIVDTMISCIDGWGHNKTIVLVRAHIEKHRGDRKEMLRAFNTIKDAAGEGHETFEDIFFTQVLETCN